MRKLSFTLILFVVSTAGNEIYWFIEFLTFFTDNIFKKLIFCNFHFVMYKTYKPFWCTAHQLLSPCQLVCKNVNWNKIINNILIQNIILKCNCCIFLTNHYNFRISVRIWICWLHGLLFQHLVLGFYWIAKILLSRHFLYNSLHK